MATTVSAAFNEFQTNVVNLDPDVTKRARASRDWLVDQIHAMPDEHDDFPVLYSQIDIHYGSFARRTKIRELDDVDLIVGLSGLGSTYTDDGGTLRITVPDGIVLRELCHDGSDILNSRKVIGRFIKHLSGVPQYAKAVLGLDESAAVLNLSSYTWSFDIVPGFMTTPDALGNTYYVIPDGAGHWKKTDPRVDRARTQRVNAAHGGHVLDAVRAVKYWNGRPTMPSMRSYLTETAVLDYYEGRATAASPYVAMEVPALLGYIAGAVLGPVQDPKGVQGDINGLTWEQRQTVSARARQDSAKGLEAQAAERAGDHKEAIRLWGQIFGPLFPTFG